MKHESFHQSNSNPNSTAWDNQSSPNPNTTAWDNLASSPEADQSPANRFRVDPANYPIFSRQVELDKHWGNNQPHHWNINKTLSTYVTNTAKLIATIDGTSTEYEKPDRLPPDHVIYLDKSARPVSWLVNTFWSDFSDQKRPEHSYLNVDRLDWFNKAQLNVDSNGYITDTSGEQRPATAKDFKLSNLPPDTFARIRALYLPEGIHSEDPAEIMQTPSSLDGKNILIVDEVSNSGATVEIAKQLIRAAFPAAGQIRGKTFWSAGHKVNPTGNEYQMLSAPVWYTHKHSDGRGIGDVDGAYYQNLYESYPNPVNHAKSYGSLIKSHPIDLAAERDQLSRELMTEIKTMHKDFENGHILLQPPNNYDDDRIDAVIEAQGLRLAPASDKSPDTFLNILKSLDSPN